MKHNPMATAHAAAVVTAIIYVVCRQAFVWLPELSMSIARSWFHGIDINKIATTTIPADNFILGLVTATVGAWLVGYLFAKLYNGFAKK